MNDSLERPEDDTGPLSKFLVFSMANIDFGIDILAVREVVQHPSITPVALSPTGVRGLMNLRGQIITVLDLGLRVNLGHVHISESSNVVVLKRSSSSGKSGNIHSRIPVEEVGLLIDDVTDVVAADRSSIEPPPAHISGVDGIYIDSIVKLQDRLVIVVDTQRVLDIQTGNRTGEVKDMNSSTLLEPGLRLQR